MLVPGVGRCVVLAQTHQQLVSCLDSVYFTDITTRGVNIGGYVCAVVMAKRSDVVFRPPIKGSDTWDEIKRTANTATIEDIIAKPKEDANSALRVGNK